MDKKSTVSECMSKAWNNIILILHYRGSVILLCLSGVTNDHGFAALCCGGGGSRNIPSVQSDTATATQNTCAKQSSANNRFIINPGERYALMACISLYKIAVDL